MNNPPPLPHLSEQGEQRRHEILQRAIQEGERLRDHRQRAVRAQSTAAVLVLCGVCLWVWSNRTSAPAPDIEPSIPVAISQPVSVPETPASDSPASDSSFVQEYVVNQLATTVPEIPHTRFQILSSRMVDVSRHQIVSTNMIDTSHFPIVSSDSINPSRFAIVSTKTINSHYSIVRTADIDPKVIWLTDEGLLAEIRNAKRPMTMMGNELWIKDDHGHSVRVN